MTESKSPETARNYTSIRNLPWNRWPWVKYALAVAATALAVVLRWALVATFGDMPLFITFYPAVALVAMLLGARAAVLATILSALAADYLFRPPVGTLMPMNLNQAVALGLFVITGLLISLMAELLNRVRQRQAASERESLLRAMAEDIPDPWFIKDRDCRVVIANAATLRAIGKPAEQVIGHSNAECFDDPVVAEMITTSDRRVMESEQQEAIEEFMPGGNGGRTYLSIKTPWRDARGRIIGVIGCARDITDRKRAEEALRESESRFQVLAQGTFEGVAISEKGRITDVNEQLARMLGYEPAELIGMEIRDLLPPEAQDPVLGNIQAGTESHVEHDIVRKDGSRLTVEAHGRNITYQNQSMRITAIHDISERKLVEQALRRYELLASGSRDIILFVDRETGRILEANAAAEKVYGYSREELKGLTFYDLRVDRHVPAQLLAEVDAKGAVFETVHRRRDGSAFPVEVSSRVGTIEGRRTYISIIRDITERKRTEEALRESEARFRTLVEYAEDAVFVQTNGRFAYLNPAALQLFGAHSPEQLLNEPIPEHVHATSRDQIRERIRWINTRREAVPVGEYTYLRLDGTSVPVEASAAPIDYAGRPGAVVFARDITDRKRAEESLRESEAKFRTLHETSPIAIVLNRLDNGQFVESNQALWDMTGYTEEEFRSLSYWDITPAEYADMEAKQLELLHTVGKYGPYEKEFVRKDGTRVPVLLCGVRLVARDGVECICSTVQDITELKEREKALRESEARFRTLFEEEMDGIMLADMDTQQLGMSNPQACRMLGYTAEEIRNLKVSDIHPAEDLPRIMEGFARQSRGEIAMTPELPVLHKDGSVFYADVIAKPVELAGRRWLLGIFRDVTERKRWQDQLKELNATLEQRVAERTAEAKHRAAQLQRLAAQLTQVEQQERQRLATLLHDQLQQQLVGAKFSLSTLRGQPLQERYLQALAQANKLIDSSLNTSRSLTGELSPAVLQIGTLAQVMRWLSRWAKEKYGLSVAVFADEEADLRTAEMRTLVFQGVRELLLNVAKHAGVNQASLRLGRESPDRVRIVVADEGVGFDWNQKAVEATGAEVGTGLGLFSIRERLELLGGSMEIDSHPGRGTRISLTAVCPLMAGAPAAERQVGREPTREHAVSEAVASQMQGENAIRVLLADDHEVVRTGLARLLQMESGIEIVGQVADGQEAVEAALQIRPDVILMDVSMPHVDGVEATRRIVQQMSNIKIIGLSMHEQEDVAASMKAAGAAMYLSKTSPPGTLVAAIRECGTRTVGIS